MAKWACSEVNERNRGLIVIVENESNLQKLQRLTDELTEKDVFSQLTDDELYGDVLDLVLLATQSPIGTFGYLNEDGDLIVPSMMRDVWGKCKVSEKDITFPRETWVGSNAIWAQAILSKVSVCKNIGCCMPEGHIKITRAVSTPIVYLGDAIGYFIIANRDTDYGENDIKLLELIARDIAPRLHARLMGGMPRGE